MSDQITVSRELLRQVLDAVTRLKPFVSGLGKAVLREIEVDVVSALEQPAVTDEIVLAACRKIAPALFTRGLTPLDTDGPNWRQRMSDVENTVRVVLSFAAPQPQQPTKVPLLTDDQIESVNNVWVNQLDYEVFEIHQPSVFEFARAIEQLVRQKVGIK